MSAARAGMTGFSWSSCSTTTTVRVPRLRLKPTSPPSEIENMTAESGAVRVNLGALERVLCDQAAAERPSETVRLALRALSGAAFCVFDSDLKVIFAEGDALADVDPGAEDLLDAHRAAITGERTQLDLRRGSKTYEVHAAPVPGSDGAVVAGLSIALDVTDERYVHLRIRRRSTGQAELTALSRRAANAAEIPQLLQQAVGAIAKTLEVDHVSIRHMDEVSGHLVRVATTGELSAGDRPALVPLTPERHASLLALAAGPELLDDVSLRPLDGPMPAESGFASMLSALIGNAEGAYGT